MCFKVRVIGYPYVNIGTSHILEDQLAHRHIYIPKANQPAFIESLEIPICGRLFINNVVKIHINRSESVFNRMMAKTSHRGSIYCVFFNGY